VLATYLRLYDEPDPGLPDRYRTARASDADDVVARVTASGGRTVAAECDLTDDKAPGELFDRAEAAFGPVDILVNNASGWMADTFAADPSDSFGRTLQRVSSATFDRLYRVDARAAALLISEFARRHIARNGS
jgi:3-oxoacyl-[acyl-carrier protein] reductase